MTQTTDTAPAGGTEAKEATMIRTATHTVTGIAPVEASGPGALAGYAASCSCGHVVKSSLECLARQWGWEHADYMNRNAR